MIGSRFQQREAEEVKLLYTAYRTDVKRELWTMCMERCAATCFDFYYSDAEGRVPTAQRVMKNNAPGGSGQRHSPIR